jgi:GntR family transcriptional regulator
MNDRPLSFRFGPISPAAEGPLYDQIVAAVKREVAAGRVESTEPLPSVRVLAAELLVSVITVKRAYEELERDGVIYKRQGLGAFLAPSGAERLREEQARTAQEGLKAAIAAGRQAGLSDEEILQLFKSELASELGGTGP